MSNGIRRGTWVSDRCEQSTVWPAQVQTRGHFRRSAPPALPRLAPPICIPTPLLPIVEPYGSPVAIDGTAHTHKTMATTRSRTIVWTTPSNGGLTFDISHVRVFKEWGNYWKSLDSLNRHFTLNLHLKNHVRTYFVYCNFTQGLLL